MTAARVTGRILGERVSIDDRRRIRVETRDGVAVFPKGMRKHETRRTNEPHRSRIGLRRAGAGARARSARAAASFTWRSANPISRRRATSSKPPSKALDEGWTHYGPTQGYPDLREAIAAYVSPTRGIEVGPEHVSRRARRQAHHLLPDARAARSRRRGDLSQSRLPHLRIDDPLPGRRAGPDAAGGGTRLLLRSRRAARQAHEPHQAGDPQLAAESHRRRDSRARTCRRSPIWCATATCMVLSDEIYSRIYYGEPPVSIATLSRACSRRRSSWTASRRPTP